MLPAFIVTLGALTYLRGIAYSFTEGKPVPIEGESPLQFIGSGAIAGIPTTVVIMAGIYLLLWFVLERTRYGRHIYAVGGNKEAARLAGIKVKRVITSAYVICGLTAGVAGIMFASRVRSGQVTGGEGYELDAIAAVILGGTSLFGGRGRIMGTLIGAIIIGVLSNGLILMGVPFYTQLIVKGTVIVLAVALDFLKGRSRA
jgi:ribose transport system permease protein